MVSGGITLRGNQRMELAFGTGRQMRRLREMLEALARIAQLRQQRGDAPYALEPTALFGQGPDLPLHGAQFGHGRGVLSLSVQPSAWCDGALLALALGATPGIHGIREATSAASVADQRLCLFIKSSQCRAKVEQPSAGKQALADLAAKPQQFAATFAQACAVETEAPFE
jgi:hypothetical protein